MEYELPVADKKVKPHQVTALHLICALAFIGTGAIIFVYNYVITYWGLALLIVGIMLLITTIGRNKWLITRNINTAFRIIELSIALSMAVLSALNGWKFPIIIYSVLSTAILFALYWERTALAPMLVHIANDGVKLPATSRNRFLPWTEIEQVVYKYGILTVDCLNNTLYQWNITNNGTDSERLEAYCYNMIEEHKKNRRTDDW
jgi:hypothetical protein